MIKNWLILNRRIDNATVILNFSSDLLEVVGLVQYNKKRRMKVVKYPPNCNLLLKNRFYFLSHTHTLSYSFNYQPIVDFSTVLERGNRDLPNNMYCFVKFFRLLCLFIVQMWIFFHFFQISRCFKTFFCQKCCCLQLIFGIHVPSRVK